MSEVTARAATFLFTDIEGSTQLLKRLREAYGGVLAQHQRLLREAFAAHGGQEVDTQGDSFFVAFARVKDAVLAAVAAQRALAAHDWPEGVEVRVRMGVHTGEAAVEENRYVGLSVHRTARICAVGRGGQILISQTTRNMLEDEEEMLPGIELRDLGDQLLKDIARPVRLSEVVLTGPRTEGSRPRPGAAPDQEVESTAGASERIVLPSAFGLTPAFPFAGRSSELTALRSLLPLAEGDGLRVALLGGEPGSGKTRVVRELTHEAAARGVLVLYGTCDAVVTAPYQPFVESLDFLVRVLDPDALRGCLGTTGGELTRLLPDLSLRLGPLPAPQKADQDTERHRLQAAVAELLIGVSRRRPVLLVVDDMHWADASSLHLLRRLARTATDARLLVIATYRDTESEMRPELFDALADLSRIEGVTRLRLRGLSAEEVAEFIQRAVGADAGAGLLTPAEAIGQLTDGNPFLLCQLWLTLLEAGALEISERRVRLKRPIAELGSPESVREVVHQRLSRLAPGTGALLEVAAVIGRQFELGVLGEAAGPGESPLVSALEEAVRSGTIEEVPGPRLAHRFTHELVRRALYDRLANVRRAELHLRVGEALERVHAANPAPILPELAHHFAAAAAVGGAERAVEYNLRAAKAATTALAFEETAARLATALELGINDEAERAQLQLELGTAHHKAARPLEAIAAFRAAAEVARARGDASTLARAAIGFEEACWRPGITDQGAVELLREAVGALGAGDSALRARLLSALSRALVFVGEPAEAGVVRSGGIAMARRLGDPATLATVLTHSHWARGTMRLEEVLEMLTEAKDLGLELGDTEVLMEATRNRVVTYIALCDMDAARHEVDAFRRVAKENRQPTQLHVAEQFGSALALCEGRLDDAEAMADEASEWGRLLGGRGPSGVYGMQLFGIRREQGRLAELRPLVQILAAERGAWAWRPGLVALLAELGLEDEARTELEQMRADGFAGVARDFTLASLAYLTDACSAIGDAESAALLYPLLVPLAGSNLQIGQLVACYGAADRYLGMLGAVMGAWDDAEAHFEYALYMNRRMGAHTWTAHTAYQYGRMLISRNRLVDQSRAGDLLAEAGESCERLGLRGLQNKIRAPGTIEQGPVELPDELSAREVAVLRLVARGASNREIGRELIISEHTAANHMRSILRKTGCANRTDAASYAHRRGLVTGS